LKVLPLEFSREIQHAALWFRLPRQAEQACQGPRSHSDPCWSAFWISKARSKLFGRAFNGVVIRAGGLSGLSDVAQRSFLQGPFPRLGAWHGMPNRVPVTFLALPALSTNVFGAWALCPQIMVQSMF
jgi:hypothetical protein